jgi:type II secretory pathway pseudopilin PulG
MENASKALLMAGGVLIALMIIGALLLMFNQLGSYQKQNYTTEAEKQLAQFNQEFAQYTDEDIKGTDLITLVNKVVDYNQKSGGVNSLNYDIKITLNINMD